MENKTFTTGQSEIEGTAGHSMELARFLKGLGCVCMYLTWGGRGVGYGLGCLRQLDSLGAWRGSSRRQSVCLTQCMHFDSFIFDVFVERNSLRCFCVCILPS